MIGRSITWLAAVGLNAAIGLDIAPYATPAGWTAFASGSLLWVTLCTWLLVSVLDSGPR